MQPLGHTWNKERRYEMLEREREKIREASCVIVATISRW